MPNSRLRLARVNLLIVQIESLALARMMHRRIVGDIAQSSGIPNNFATAPASMPPRTQPVARARRNDPGESTNPLTNA
jgi:hypothetical protein